MSHVKLDMETLAGGKALADVNAAIDDITDNLDETDLIGRPRTITLKMTIVPKKDGFVTVSHAVAVKVPSRERSSVAWVEGGSLRTMAFSPDGRQAEITVDRDGNIVPIDQAVEKRSK